MLRPYLTFCTWHLQCRRRSKRHSAGRSTHGRRVLHRVEYRGDAFEESSPVFVHLQEGLKFTCAPRLRGKRKKGFGPVKKAAGAVLRSQTRCGALARWRRSPLRGQTRPYTTRDGPSRPAGPHRAPCPAAVLAASFPRYLPAGKGRPLSAASRLFVRRYDANQLVHFAAETRRKLKFLISCAF